MKGLFYLLFHVHLQKKNLFQEIFIKKTFRNTKLSENVWKCQLCKSTVTSSVPIKKVKIIRYIRKVLEKKPFTCLPKKIHTHKMYKNHALTFILLAIGFLRF